MNAVALSADQTDYRRLAVLEEMRAVVARPVLPLAAVALQKARTDLAYEAAALADEVARQRALILEAEHRVREIHDTIGEIDRAIDHMGGLS